MKISIIIPTHNRADTLENAINSVVSLNSKVDFEFVIVDNNSSDHTREVIEKYKSIAKYVFEGNTSFTCARDAGAKNAQGDIFLYLDDDVLVKPGALEGIVDVFNNFADCGVIAGRIDPHFVESPPQWALDCQASFNGWSLFNPKTYEFITDKFQEVNSAAGPMMAIRKEVYERVGGFPPDTVGVETNKGPKSFNKLYIGPGDYGLCYSVRQLGYKIYYSADIAVEHVIPPVRSTIKFWRSRMIGEGYHMAITEQAFFSMGWLELRYRQLSAKINFFKNLTVLKHQVLDGKISDGMSTAELWLHYHKSYLEMRRVLHRSPGLVNYLWKVGKSGVSDGDYDEVQNTLPLEYKYLVSSEYVYDEDPIDNAEKVNKFFFKRGFCRPNNLVLAYRLERRVIQGLLFLKSKFNKV